MKILKNHLRGTGLQPQDNIADGDISTDHLSVLSLLQHCPSYTKTPLVDARQLAANIGIANLYIKDERDRMGLGSFKALGAAYVIAKAAYQKSAQQLLDPTKSNQVLDGQVFVSSSAGNHGISIAVGARIFGANAVIYLSKTVPAGFAEKLEALGAQVVIEGHDYEASLEAAKKAAIANNWTLLSDSTWEGYSDGRDVMEGYLALVHEIVESLGDTVPTHIFLQAGVGGLAGAVTAMAREVWGDKPIIFVVEPSYATALMSSIEAGKPVIAPGPMSSMGRLDCKEPSHLALKCLAKDADYFVALEDEEVANYIEQLEEHKLSTSPSGGAGFAGLCALLENTTNPDDLSAKPGKHSQVLVILSEGEQKAE